MDTVGTALCQAIRDFATITCPRYRTRELPRETRARTSRQQEQAKRGKGTKQRRTAGVKDKPFNTTTFKLHCIPDYVPTIRKYGTTDSYSTQTVSLPPYPLAIVLLNKSQQSELAHRLSKMWYRVSNKNRAFINQITSRECRTRFYCAMLEEINKEQNPPASVPESQPRLNNGDTPSHSSERYWIPKAATVKDLTSWLVENRGDPALRVSVRFVCCWLITLVFTQDFRPRLLDHLYSRIKGRPYDGDELYFSGLEHDNIIIEQNRMYEHKTIRFRSTTYDGRRMEESANPHAHADIMVLSHEDGVDGRAAFPYWHARIIGIYHFMVSERTEGEACLSSPSRMDVLLVRWLGFDSPDGQSGWRARQLHKIGFLPDTDVHGPAFGFLDPKEVIRMVHLIPDFASIRTKDLLTGKSMAVPDPGLDGEYPTYYVAM